LGLLHPDFRLDLVILVDDLDGEAAKLAAEMIEPKLEGIAHVVADRGRRAGERADEADLDRFVLSCGGSRQEREHRGSGNACPDHVRFFPLVGALSSAELFWRSFVSITESADFDRGSLS
jgi:hypothetical protein